MQEHYVTGKQATSILGVHIRTLYQWDAKGWIETIRSPSNQRLYNVEKYLKTHKDKYNKMNITNDDDTVPEGRMYIIYVRVSSLGQKDDLERQKEMLVRKYPKYYLIEDIGSGMNLNRRGFRKMIDWAIEGKIEEVVVAHKDRLARFGYELFEDLLQKYSNGKITIDSKQDKKPIPEADLVEDVLQVMNIFVAKMNGLRKYKKNQNQA